jgi:cobalt-zinc-cadmium efflux system outer membrane protein
VPVGPRASRTSAPRPSARAPRSPSPNPKRDLPALAVDAALVDLIHYTFQSNAEIEAAYYDWRAALERVPQAVALDDPRLAYQYMLAPSRMTRWDRTTLGLGQMVPFPGKRELAGKVAFAAAVAAGHRFEGAKFDLQADVVESACMLWLAEETVRIGQANLDLLRQARETAQQLVAVGRATQADATKADLEVGIAENDLHSQQAAVAPALARLNAILSRPPAARLRPQAPDAPGPLPADDRVLALVAERNPGLSELAASLGGREDALELARKAWLPDFEFSLSLTGSIERMLMGAINLPLQVDRIRGGIAEADAMANAARVMLRARRDDLGASGRVCRRQGGRCATSRLATRACMRAVP